MPLRLRGPQDCAQCKSLRVPQIVAVRLLRPRCDTARKSRIPCSRRGILAISRRFGQRLVFVVRGIARNACNLGREGPEAASARGLVRFTPAQVRRVVAPLSTIRHAPHGRIDVEPRGAHPFQAQTEPAEEFWSVIVTVQRSVSPPPGRYLSALTGASSRRGRPAGAEYAEIDASPGVRGDELRKA